MLGGKGDHSSVRVSWAIGKGRSNQRRGWCVRGEAGSTLVEFALSSSVLFLVVFGIIAVSLALYSYNFVSDAAREATRWAIVRGSNCSLLTDCGATSDEIQTYVRSLGYPGITATSLTVTTNWLSASAAEPTTWTACAGSGCDAPGNAVQVKVAYAYPLNIPFWNTTTLNISATSQMVVANYRAAAARARMLKNRHRVAR